MFTANFLHGIIMRIRAHLLAERINKSIELKEIMKMAEELLLTKEGYDKIVAEHEELVTVRRKEIAERIKEAISYGDISENSEYDSAKNEQAELEERISKLENMMRKAKIIDESTISNDRVGIGLKVKVLEIETNEVMEFTIVGSTEADPFEGKISNESLVGAALLGKMVNEVAEVQVPDGIVHYKVVDISR
jgi:transcription elongation factor GreA